MPQQQPSGASADPRERSRLDLSDEEVDALCAGLKQNAAKVRFIRQILKIPVARRPNGRPLVRRADLMSVSVQTQNVSPPVGPRWSKNP